MGALYYLVESASVVAQDCFRSSILCSLASSLFIFFALLYSRITDHRISVQRIGAEYFGLSFIQISFMRISTGSEFACSKAILSLHLPRSSAPYFGLFTACDLEYKDTDCHISVSKLCTKLWFFPLFFRFTSGSWISAELDDFRIRIFSSSHTPYYVKLMRRNLIGALTKGEVLRLDGFRVEFKLGGLFKVTPREDDADKEAKTTTQEEFRMTALGEQCHIVNQERRYYTFPNVVAQLRRDWVQGNGSFTMIAKESRWTRVHHPYKRYAFTKFSYDCLVSFLVRIF